MLAFTAPVVLTNARHGLPINCTQSKRRHVRPRTCIRATISPPAVANAQRTVLETDITSAPVLSPGSDYVVPLESTTLSNLSADLLVIAVSTDDDKEEWKVPADLAALNTQGELSELVADFKFKAKAGSKTETLRMFGSDIKRVVLYGLGKTKSDVDDDDTGILETVAKCAKFTVKKAADTASIDSVALYVSPQILALDGVVATISENACIATFKDKRFKGDKKKDDDDEEKDDKKPSVSKLAVVTDSLNVDQVRRGQVIANGIMKTKELGFAPSNSLTPERLADAAREIAAECGLAIKVMGKSECMEHGMGSYLGVSQGSLREPQFIHMTYTPSGKIMQRIALVGKAVTHDTGGYSIKTGPSIAAMKIDMAGSAAVFGTASIIGKLKPPGVEVHFIAPACENMISDKAIHPGDVLTASNGKTVEVMNSDAEGRLCLADALVYADKNIENLDAMVNIATLTGAIVVALGTEVAGFWCNNDAFAEEVKSCGAMYGEKLWRMPLVKSYKKTLESSCADLRNIGKKGGGSSITAALFLQEFVECEKWAHIDIAGTASGDEAMPTGFGIKTMLALVENYAANNSAE